MNDLATIESYLTGRMADSERGPFEASLRTDPDLANTLAFYVMARHSAKVAAHEQRHAEWTGRRRAMPGVLQPLRRLGQWGYPVAAAACLMLALGVGWYTVNKPSAGERADTYIAQHFSTLSVTMGGEADSLQTGIGYYNAGNLAGAAARFGAILAREPTNADALKFAGLVALRQGNYDQAIGQFHRLSQRTDLYANPGLLYEAIARIKRNKPLDKPAARGLLTDVIGRNLDGKSEAEKLLESL